MCNNLEDAKTLEGDFLMKANKGKVRCDTVASSASTTARVAAVIQRGGFFLSGSFVNKSWAEDAAGRSTVCLTRSISYTALISPIEMMGMFGMAQVIGAKTYGVQILPPEPVPWSPPLIVLNRTDEELMQKWSINQPPQWADIPLAIRYQIQESNEGHEQKRQKRQPQEVVYRLRLTLAWTFSHNVLKKFEQEILAAASNNWPSVPQQSVQKEDPFLYAVVWAYALDLRKSPTFIVIPRDAHSIRLLRVDTQKLYDVQRGGGPLQPLQGMAFFDAWRIFPNWKLAPDAQMYGQPKVDPSPERDQWDVDAERTVASQMEHYSSRQETPKDQHAFEISKAALDALKDLDEGLRTQLGMMTPSMCHRKPP